MQRMSACGTQTQIIQHRIIGVEFQVKILNTSWVLVAHTYNPSYLGDREDYGSKSAWANSSWDPISKITREK
jgi:hypothetical protein